MPKTDDTERVAALEGLFQALLEKRADKKIVETCKPWSDRAVAEDVLLILDRAIDRGLDFNVLKPAVSKLLNLLYDSLKRRRYEMEEGEYFFRSLMRENQEAVELLDRARAVVASLNINRHKSYSRYVAEVEGIRDFAKKMESLEIHYRKKENVLFPNFEARYPQYRCVRLMWSIHDDVRNSLRRLLELCDESPPQISDLNGEIGKLYFGVHAVIFREEYLVFPVFSKFFDKEERNLLFAESSDFGFCFLPEDEVEMLSTKAREFTTSLSRTDLSPAAIRGGSDGFVLAPNTALHLNAGVLSLETLNALLTTIPVDMTFVDAEGRVAWYSNSRDRIFPRSPSVLGRDVRNCHPKESVGKVEAILDAFRNGKSDHETFWIQMKNRFIHIEYFALRAPGGRFLGTLEVSQDLTGKRTLSGEKRLSDVP